jgi:D-glycero-D-manno-heptose 1,7-bisphosphate phosphatase
MTSRAVFLDRDGVINADRSDLVKSWDEFEFLPARRRRWRLSLRSPHKIVVVINQSGVGRGLLTEAALAAKARANDQSSLLLWGKNRRNLLLHLAPDAGCGCRKPAPGLSREAARYSGIELSLSSTIGDSDRDVQAANHLGGS